MDERTVTNKTYEANIDSNIGKTGNKGNIQARASIKTYRKAKLRISETGEDM
jgi:hypothetical protein